MAPKPKQKVTIHIDPNKWSEQIKEIEKSHLEEDQSAGGEGDYDLEWLDNEEEEEEETVLKLYEPSEPSVNIGRIDLSFPETTQEFANTAECYLPSYYTHSSKERLILLYAENFRRQFCFLFPKRRPLVLAPYNECNIQKFVCTTIRPTAFAYVPLIADEVGIARFVSDFIVYEPLKDIIETPTTLISPATLLRRRRGTSFEMATLLCSMLIGARFPAMVVSGVAKHRTIMNDTTALPYPFPIEDFEIEEEVESKNVKCVKYKLRPIPDIHSHLEEIMLENDKIKAEEDKAREAEARKRVQELHELIPIDRFHYRRSHAWVVIVQNAPWTRKPIIMVENEFGDTVEAQPKPIFIEPASGYIFEQSSDYILIDSVWDNKNYYVNKQDYKRVREIRWDFNNMDDWEHLLLGEPRELVKLNVKSDENVTDVPILVDKHLDIDQSWVMRLHIGEADFEQRYPDLQKTVRYHKVVHENFSPYSQRDGKIEQILIYGTSDYRKPVMRYEYYKNRSDKLEKIKYDHDTSIILEVFGKGRNDNLHYMEHKLDVDEDKRLYFYSESRLDSLKYLEVRSNCLLLTYGKRIDRCIAHEFDFKPHVQVLKKITEKFSRNHDIPHYQDISQRTYIFNQRKVVLKFHYAPGALTASTREFIKPMKPNYGEELKFDPSLTKFYKANPEDPDAPPLDLYLLLLEQLKQEEKLIKLFEKVWDDMNATLDLRLSEVMNPKLKFSIFDPLRNGAARAIHIKQYEDEEAYRLKVESNPPDFLAPYLVAYDNEITPKESYVAFTSCLLDLRTRFVTLLNCLQRQYEELTAEAKALQRFLSKFQDQFSNYDYERLVNEGNSLELNKRMIQQRLTLTHEEAQKKYEEVRASLFKDPRLKLTPEVLSRIQLKGF
ncbi:coiled-coil domain-containing protein lobo [Teleopsis dalmanni]|uniref:coiled-coil domain-containing protein lobo n=1 Tax=Teleopsis dalmanni TaxID=139649 RepID=UPI0018CD2E7C|nr:coiled-coil domain-containing protein lobo [Teleopsis dalmanni]